ncbi:endoplasmic reticulum-Golgi intermediate compartment protein 3-like [Tritrichomonas foetus]|uniref:Endoplasmic reticulum-Golgi intermediate compartment protein 3-like n=1 Tax=Tritrichomonas foetus TaxID=1144522 RepID=A0A1J4KAT2_9EUKA|nr:endoplasmic reticulum-Golgi intermediate compartment protein 3-like [Tritrichomonas foetus]|eukprot:OHT06565.1 endoplasmic reticulum-Golgi intermediate compartment protein 3-like [Tritrichomonas foetus]
MRFTDLDIFPKLRNDYSRQATTGGFITLTSILIMIALFISHVISFFTTPLPQRIRIDESPLPTTEGNILDIPNQPKLHFYIDIELTHMPCPFVDFGVIDTNKEIHSQAFSKVKLTPLDSHGNKIKRNPKPLVSIPNCGSCYGAASGCCNTCKEVKRAFKAKGRVPPPLSTIDQCKNAISDFKLDEKCHLKGVVEVPPASGIVFISPGDSYTERSQHVADYLAMNMTINDFNMSHIIHHFSIENEESGPLDSISKVQKAKGRMKSMYFVRAIKEVVGKGNHYRMGVTHYERFRQGKSGKFPSIYFYYDVAPIVVEHKRDVSVLHFLVDLMAVLGGIFSLATMIEHILMKSSNSRTSQSI